MNGFHKPSIFLHNHHHYHHYGSLVESVIKVSMIELSYIYYFLVLLQNDTTYFGAIVGRVANRIDGAQFWLNGHHYNLVPNEGNNTLHGIYL